MSHLPRPLRRALQLASLSLVLGAPAAHADEPVDYTPFAADSVWNLPLRDDAPLDPDSASYVDDFLRNELTTGNRWINSTSCGMPIYWADADTPRVPVAIHASRYQDPALKRAWSAVPIPAAAKPANCSDGNLAVFQRQPDGSVTQWEFWKASKAADGRWTASWGGVTKDVARDSGIASAQSWWDATPGLKSTEKRSNTNWNVTASSVSQSAGVITMADLRRGSIDHALAFAIGAPAAGRFRFPAQRTDGSSSRRWALPEGTRLRLDPSLDLSKRSMTPLVRMLAVAAQRHGIVVRDKTGADDVFYTEEPHAGWSSPLKALNNGKSASETLKAFPWSSLQVLAAPVCTSAGNCRVDPAVRIAVDGTPATGASVTLDTSNSALNAPRSAVRWDLDGDGAYETDGGTAVKRSLALTTAGERRVGVQITDRAGAVVTGSATFTVTETRAAAPAPPQATPAPTATATPQATPAPTAQATPAPTATTAPQPAATAAPSPAASQPAATSPAPAGVRDLAQTPGAAPAPATRAVPASLALPRTLTVRKDKRLTLTATLRGAARHGTVTAAVKDAGTWTPLAVRPANGRTQAALTLPASVTRKPTTIRVTVAGSTGRPLTRARYVTLRPRD